MQKKNITVSKTARYFMLGDPAGDIQQIWFVCHGYAQLADDFITNFDSLNNGKNLVVAPEGLHRFYWKGFSDEVVASWMTRVDRADEINDYVNYLDAVYLEVLSQVKNKDVKINVLGFSQGTATICRWVERKKIQLDNLILWGGAFPADIDFKNNRTYFNSAGIFFIVGDGDQFIKEDNIKEHEQVLTENQIQYTLIRFKGKHEITEEVLKQLAEQF